MKQRYNNYSHDLAWLAIDACFKDKWNRNDVLTFIEEWTGYSRREMWMCEATHFFRPRYDAMESMAYMLDDVMEGIQNGIYPDLDAVKIRQRPDGMTGKMRDIAYLCILHQLLGHVVKLGLDPLFRARILPTQHASLPEHGQTRLVRQTRRYLRKRMGIKCYQKTDCTHAYASLQYSVVIDLIRQEIPNATWILKTLDFLATMAPGGHLIIGGYLDAWLFNFAMSYALRDTLSQGKTRRGKFQPYVERIESFMDDFALLSRTETGIKRAVKHLTAWMWENLRMTVRTTTGIIYWLSSEEERRRQLLNSPAARGCPNLDMGGYRICRTHVTMRRRVAKRVFRTFKRAWKELKATGSLRHGRAGSIIARNGPVQCSYSEKFKNKYHVSQLISAAKRVNAYWQRCETRKRKEKIAYVLQRCASQPSPFSRAGGAPA